MHFLVTSRIKIFLVELATPKAWFFLSFLIQQVSSSADPVSRLFYRFIPLYFYLLFSIFFDSNYNWLHLTACYDALHRRCLAIFNYSCGAVSVCIIQPSFWSQRVYKWKVNSAKGRVAHLPCLLETYWVFCNIKPLPLPCILSTLLASAIVWCSSRRAYWNRNLRLREASLGTLTRPFSFFSWLFYCIKNFCNPTMKENRTALWAC